MQGHWLAGLGAGGGGGDENTSKAGEAQEPESMGHEEVRAGGAGLEGCRTSLARAAFLTPQRSRAR